MVNSPEKVPAGRYGTAVGFEGEFGDEGPGELTAGTEPDRYAAGVGGEALDGRADGAFVLDALVGEGCQVGVVGLDRFVSGLDCVARGHGGDYGLCVRDLHAGG